MLLLFVVLLLGWYPWWAACWRNRHSALFHTLIWALLAWGAWVVAALLEVAEGQSSPLASYLALSLTGCLAIAVLGARRPGASAWHFVVVGLLVVLMRPVLEGLGELKLRPAHLIFLVVFLGLGFLNYLPTRLGLASLFLGVGSAGELLWLSGMSEDSWVHRGSLLLVALAPWVGWCCLAWRQPPSSELERTWRAYRDRFGALWALRMREQFNRAMHNGNWPVVLGWNGLQPAHPHEALPTDLTQPLAILRATLQRFEERRSVTEPEA